MLPQTLGKLIILLIHWTTKLIESNSHVHLYSLLSHRLLIVIGHLLLIRIPIRVERLRSILLRRRNDQLLLFSQRVGMNSKGGHQPPQTIDEVIVQLLRPLIAMRVKRHLVTTTSQSSGVRGSPPPQLSPPLA